jgi:hypothetical protein
MALQVHACFCRESEHPIETLTINISASGFYCVLDQTVLPGEQIICLLTIPEPAGIRLSCRVRVLRVEILDKFSVAGNDQFGVACSILDYHAVTLPSVPCFNGSSVHS